MELSIEQQNNLDELVKAASILGKKGGSSTSEKKKIAVRKNFEKARQVLKEKRERGKLA